MFVTSTKMRVGPEARPRHVLPLEFPADNAISRLFGMQRRQPCPLRAARHGSVAEWFKALVLKTSVRGTVPWVRIPPLPPPHSALILNDFMPHILWRGFRNMRGAMPSRDLKLRAK